MSIGKDAVLSQRRLQQTADASMLAYSHRSLITGRIIDEPKAVSKGQQIYVRAVSTDESIHICAQN